MQKIVLFVSIVMSINIYAQNSNEVLLTIDGNKITCGEFERIYTKNNKNPSFDSVSLAEYMDLFINFKLKVIEAEELGMDTLKSFKTELKGYRVQLEKPYFTDESVDEQLMKEAYDRMQWDIRASHILIRCGSDALPADTLKAYNKIARIRKEAVSGKDFAKLAKEYSEDPSAKKNGGDLGFFTAFSMVYPFESAAYNTPVGKISKITRTKYGYHIIKVTDKRKDRGQIKVAHIMRTVPQGSGILKDEQQKQMIYQIYDSLKAGADFAEMAKKYSDDRGTSSKGGELPYFGAGRMIPEFEKAAFSLKNIGDVSKPIKTFYGYHIIKLIDVKPIGSYEDLKPTIKKRISKDVRARKGRAAVMARLKKEYKLKINEESIKPFYKVIDSTIFTGEWDATKAKGLNKTMFTLEDTLIFTQQDFAQSISNDGLRRIKRPLQLVVDDEFNRYVEKIITDIEKSRLEEKYADFKNLLQEYHDGILLFNLTDEMVWSKAVKDTAGLEKFYEKNKNNYMWGDRVEATLYTFNNQKWEPQIKKLAIKTGKKNLDVQSSLDKFLKKAKAKDSTLTVTVEKNKFSKGENDIVDLIKWTPGIKEPVKRDDKIVIAYVNKQIPPEPKKLKEVRGLVTADYQNYLEKQWIKELREKHDIKINEDVFKSMIK